MVIFVPYPNAKVVQWIGRLNTWGLACSACNSWIFEQIADAFIIC